VNAAEPIPGFTDVAAIASSIALTLPRIAAAFIVLPLLSGQSIPPLARNSFLVSLAVMIYPVAAAIPAAGAGLPAGAWPLIVIKEMLIGAVLGFLFSAIFWAVSAAGNLIDTKAGSNFAAVVDPLQGHETSLTGTLLSQLTAWLFMASGAFMLFLDLLMSSYALWPVARMLPPLPASGQNLAIAEFSSLFTTALLLAAPALVVLSLIDLSFGLINRYAQQLNVLTFAFSIKAWVATWIVLLSLGTFTAIVTQRLLENRGLLQFLQRML
jgi:type III secretion protein T